jgi:hypothetical protein
MIGEESLGKGTSELLPSGETRVEHSLAQDYNRRHSQLPQNQSIEI